MTEHAGGLNFEDRVVAALQRLGAELERSAHLDHHLGIDYCLHGFPGYPLIVWPLDVQLTLQGGNLAKLRAFRNRTTGRATKKLYVVADDRMTPLAAAKQQKRLAKRISGDPGYLTSEKTGVFLCKNGPYALFDIDERIEHLSKRIDPATSVGRRIHGSISGLGRNGTAEITGDDGKTYRLRLGEAAAPRLKVQLQSAEEFADLLIACRVTFIPHEGFALSVLLE